MNFKLSKYIIPSVISMVLVGTYTNIDGFFIGNVTGDDGLAAINIVWPIVAFITSLGTGIGVGGSVLLSKYKGENDIQAAEHVKSAIVALLTISGFLTGLILKLIYKPLLVLMGAEGQVLTYSVEYAEIICAGAVLQILGSGLVAVLRNEQKTYFSMFCCIVGLIVHLVLDIILVGKSKLSGVAISTVVSQGVIMVLCMLSLKYTDKRMHKEHFIPILKASTSPLGINFVPSVVLLFTNYFALNAGGTAGVSAYAVMSYAVYTFDYIYQGVCDGVQPIISYCYGAKDKSGEIKALKSSALILATFTLLFIVLTPGLISVMPKLFSVSETAEEMMKMGFIIYAVSYPFKAAVKFICSYYYACGKTTISNLLIYVDPLILTPLSLLLLSNAVGMNGIWLSLVVSQLIVTILGMLSFRKRTQG